MKRKWIRLLWWLFPRDYRRDVSIRMLRCHIWWAERDRKTADEIGVMLKDISNG